MIRTPCVRCEGGPCCLPPRSSASHQRGSYSFCNAIKGVLFARRVSSAEAGRVVCCPEVVRDTNMGVVFVYCRRCTTLDRSKMEHLLSMRDLTLKNVRANQSCVCQCTNTHGYEHQVCRRLARQLD